MKREQNEDFGEMYLRTRLKKILAGKPSFLDKYAPLDWNRADRKDDHQERLFSRGCAPSV